MITHALLDKFAWLNTEYVKPPISGIVLCFPGLGSCGMKAAPDVNDLEWGHAGALTVLPYQDPWGWMNPSVLHFVDDLVDAIRDWHHLGEEVPLLSTGGSMGGHAALFYTMKSRHRVAACMALWPVCDLPFHYTEREDLPRTMHHAFGNYEDITVQLRENSPLHQVEAMPDIPYLLVHGEKDQAVKKTAHSDPMVAAMRQRRLQVEYVERPNLGHGAPLDYETNHKITDFVISHLKRAK
jgi:alpha-beta hydrolase superfamily lysophospholipase